MTASNDTASDVASRTARALELLQAGQFEEAEAMLGALLAANPADGDLLGAGQRAEIEALMTNVGQRCDWGDLDALEAATKALAHGTEHFAAERMNRGIRQALAGRTIDQV